MCGSITSITPGFQIGGVAEGPDTDGLWAKEIIRRVINVKTTIFPCMSVIKI